MVVLPTPLSELSCFVAPSPDNTSYAADFAPVPVWANPDAPKARHPRLSPPARRFFYRSDIGVEKKFN